MERYFNTEGCCRPFEHYMVKLTNRLEQIKQRYIDRGKYFIINRGRQYGKTTTLKALAVYLKPDYLVLPMDFQMISTQNFASEQAFATAFLKYMDELIPADNNSKNMFGVPKRQEGFSMDALFRWLSRFCGAAEKPVVLMIDEVDSASNNQVFLDFLSQLRGYYLNRDNRPIFHSVILTGVYDIKNLNLKLRPQSEHQYNSPWNIAAKFTIDMNFSACQIADMLEEYKRDRQISIDVDMASEEIFQYTSGYPYLVSAICKYLDEEIAAKKGCQKRAEGWTRKGIIDAVKLLLNENSPLFGSMIRNLDEYPELKQMLYAMLFQGKRVVYNPDHKIIELACMFGYVVHRNGDVQVANRIFETRLYNFFLSEEELASAMSNAAKLDSAQFISNGKLDMNRVLEKFVEDFTDIYGENDANFVEDYGRKFFLLYLKPIINGTGNYYIEAQTRDSRRTDVIVDYLGERFVVEMKIWRGNEYHEKGERQLMEYLDYFHQKKGYLLSFNFNKKKKLGVKTMILGDKVIVEAVV
ncbi:MAG: ATP-binding protein [Eubacterium sp.]|nr:ATP-binding protein [Eubacterium sp.]